MISDDYVGDIQFWQPHVRTEGETMLGVTVHSCIALLNSFNINTGILFHCSLTEELLAWMYMLLNTEQTWRAELLRFLNLFA
jgi:hypothetical protein